MDTERGLDACKAWLKGKTVTLMGLGVLGRGIGDAAFFATYADHVIVTDIQKKEALASSVALLSHHANITFVLGEHRESDFTQVDIVCKGAGVAYDSPYIAAARGAGVEVVMSTAVFATYARMTGATLIGVTGTRGKTTVTHMIKYVLDFAQQDGFDALQGRAIEIGGNIRGMSTLQCLERVQRGDIYVLELDSWQLQGFRDMSISPHISVFTTFMEDHVNYYKGNVDLYLDDKAQIFMHQHSDDVCVLGSQCAQLVTSTYGDAYAGTFETPPTDMPRSIRLSVLGEHNRYNASLAAHTVSHIGIPLEKAYSSLETFKGVPGRLERIAIEDGVVWINDTTATTPKALLTAVEAVEQGGLIPFVLIAGGADKQLTLEDAVEAVKRAQVAVLLPGTGTDKLVSQLEPHRFVLVQSMHEAVERAHVSSRELSAKAVLFSPGFASFGLFKNEYDRGDSFVKEVGVKVP